MRIDAVPFDALTAAEIGRWSALQIADERFRSPFFRPEYVRTVASIQAGVKVGRLIDGGETVGFFPFQLVRPGEAGPVGGRRCNYHGVIAAPGVEWDRVSLLRGCGVHAWHFHHLLADQQQFGSSRHTVSGSPFLDLSAGFDAYERARRDAGSHVCHRIFRSARRLERDLGAALRLEANVDDADALGLLVRWKSDHAARTGGGNKFADPALLELLTALHRTRTESFAGMLSVLYAGNRPIAVHFGLRSRTEWHYWFPSYDAAVRSVSPGLILLLEMARAASALGIRTIDLGKGAEPYKTRVASGEIAVAQGTATVPSLAAAIRGVRRTLAAVKRNLLAAARS